MSVTPGQQVLSFWCHGPHSQSGEGSGLLFQNNFLNSINKIHTIGLPWWLRGKESAFQAGDTGLIPESERSPREGNGNPLQYYCLGNSMDRGAWWAI